MSIFSRKVRGFRVIEIVATGILLTLVLAVYLAKAGAGRERAEIAQVEASIDDEQQQMRLLQAEVAHLEQPERLERLSTVYLGLAPVDPKHEAPAEALPEIAQGAAPATAPGADKAVAQ